MFKLFSFFFFKFQINQLNANETNTGLSVFLTAIAKFDNVASIKSNSQMEWVGFDNNCVPKCKMIPLFICVNFVLIHCQSDFWLEYFENSRIMMHINRRECRNFI